MSETTPYFRAVVRAIRRIPKGRVATYGQIAALAGKPGAARAVAWILHSSSRTQGLPWHRVISSAGKVAFSEGTREHALQVSRLAAEGVESEHGKISLTDFGWRPRSVGSARPNRKSP